MWARGQSGVTTEQASFVSTNVESAEYDTETRALAVTFARDGSTYVYQNVPDTVWAAFQQASSPGRFVATELKGRY